MSTLGNSEGKSSFPHRDEAFFVKSTWLTSFLRPSMAHASLIPQLLVTGLIKKFFFKNSLFLKMSRRWKQKVLSSNSKTYFSLCRSSRRAIFSKCLLVFSRSKFFSKNGQQIHFSRGASFLQTICWPISRRWRHCRGQQINISRRWRHCWPTDHYF